MSKKLEEILEESASSHNLSKLSEQSSANTSSSDAGIYNTANSNETCNQNGHALPWTPDELGDNVYLNHLNDWSFPIFQFYDTNNEHVLSQVGLSRTTLLGSTLDKILILVLEPTDSLQDL